MSTTPQTPSALGTPEPRPQPARSFLKRLVRRVFCCTRGVHWNVEYIEDGERFGFSRGGRCLDCGYSWKPLVWPRMPARNKGVDMSDIIAELKKDPPPPNSDDERRA